MGNNINDIATTSPDVFIKKHGIPSVDALKIRLERLRKTDINIGSWNKNALTDYQQQAVIKSLTTTITPQQQHPTTTTTMVRQQQQQQQQPIPTTTTTNDKPQQQRMTFEELQQQAEARRQQLIQEQQQQQREREAREHQQQMEAERLKRQQEYDHQQRMEEIKLERQREANRIVLEQQAEQRRKETEAIEAELQRRLEEAENISYFTLPDLINYLIIAFTLIGFYMIGVPAFVFGCAVGLFDVLTLIVSKRKHLEQAAKFCFWVTCIIALFGFIVHYFTFADLLGDPSVNIPQKLRNIDLPFWLSIGVVSIHLSALQVTRLIAKDNSTI